MVNRSIELQQQQQQHLRMSKIDTYTKSQQTNSMKLTHTYIFIIPFTITKFNTLDTTNI